MTPSTFAGSPSDVRGRISWTPPSTVITRARDRVRLLGGLVVRLLRRSGISGAVRGDGPLATVAFRYSGHPYVVGLAQTAEWELPATEAAVHETRRSAPGASAVVLSISGFEERMASTVAGSDWGGTVLWDRGHLEAVLCGLVPLTELLDASINAAFFRNAPYEPLIRLLPASSDEAADDGSSDEAFAGGLPPQMATPDQLPPPWPVTGPGARAEAQVVLVGEEGWPRPSGSGWAVSGSSSPLLAAPPSSTWLAAPAWPAPNGPIRGGCPGCTWPRPTRAAWLPWPCPRTAPPVPVSRSGPRAADRGLAAVAARRPGRRTDPAGDPPRPR
ncbi:MAG TPA: hypothetical protein VGG75_38775 [Trebonia sp.]|jgi:hypothetical protein